MSLKSAIVLGLVSIGALLAGCASVPSADKDPLHPVRLQVSVTVPPTMNLWRADEIAEAFGYRVCTELHEEGIGGRVKYVESYDTADAGLPVLAINLIEWRVNRVGNVDCTFSAVLSGPGGKKDLGLFSGSSVMLWPRHDILARSDGFEDAAHSAMEELSKRITASGLVTRG